MNGLDLAQDLAQRLRGHWRRSLAEPLWGRSAILVLHRVLPSEQDARLPHRAPWCLGPESFERLLVALCDVARLVSLPTAMATHHDPKARIALTFDDGWRDNIETAIPLLEHYAIPASIFVNTAWLGRPGGHWREVIGEGLWQAHAAPRIREAMGDAGLPLPPMPPRHPDDAYSRALLAYFMQLGQVNPQRLADVAAQLCDEPGLPHHGIDPFSMRRLESDGLIRFGARGVDFTAFEPQSEERIRWQVQRSRRTLARLCREPLPVLAYPEEHPSARVQQIVQRCGIQAALAGSGGWLSHRSNPLALPRIAIAQPVAHSPGRLFDYLLGQL
ncbi:polysaccharide deacetylase [Modicisalibacter xianhensis]|uniref:Polysaccharide deacetylase n=1 Tax=Modicisalibacter xianhensis TaxID=442341 RepID=A0A4R8FHL0_9GAMM|nr:polysaccharide deacetylase family protein [Halomonas xianhensis]TDX25499.1 polysaccharide deacetylase [Halomonas xianhensis]